MYFLVMNEYAEINRGSKSLLKCLDSCGRSAYGGAPFAVVTIATAREAKIMRRVLKYLLLKAGSSVFYFDKELVLTV